MSDISKSGNDDDLLDAIERLNEQQIGQAGMIRGLIQSFKKDRRERAQDREELAEVKQAIGRGPSGWTVAVWMKEHGYQATMDVWKHEGGVLYRICQARGITPGPKVVSGAYYPATIWPMEAIRIWWPQCCERYGWDLWWKYK
jgi:hypothetical protein